jgi:hypothetical protein
MKKHISLIVLSMFLMSWSSFGQCGAKVTTAWNYWKEKKLVKAEDYIQQAMECDDTKNEAKTWYYKGLIYTAIQMDTSYHAQFPDALNIAFESMKKCEELDKKEKKPKYYNTRNSNGVFADLGIEAYNVAIDKYNIAVASGEKEDFTTALKAFEKYMEILDYLGQERMGIVLGTLERFNENISYLDGFYYAAVCASRSDEDDLAKKYYEILVQSGYNSWQPYYFYADILLKDKEYDGAIASVEKGKEMFKDNPDAFDNLTIKELQIYEAKGEMDVLIDKLENSIMDNPDNPNLYISLAEAYYTKSQYHYIQSKLVDVYMDKGLLESEIIGTFGDPTSKEDLEDGSVKFFFDKRYIILKKNDKDELRVDSWNLEADADKNVMHQKFADKYRENAIRNYKDAIAKLSDDNKETKFKITDKIGAIYYNTGVDAYNLYSSGKLNDEESEKVKAEYEKFFELATPFLEESNAYKPSEITKRMLQKIYILNEQYDKLKELNAQ